LKKLANRIKRVGLIGNSEKALCRSVVRTAARLIALSGREVISDAATARLAGLKSTVCPDAAALVRLVDLLLVFGGDGTMLRVAREVAGARTPILGINIGGLGFLTAVSSPGLARALKQVWQSDFTLESRALIEASGRCNGISLRQRALNDVVISRGAEARLIELEVSVDGQLLTRYRCDGLIVSSPSGSTAYALAAGGAIVSPTAEVFSITPICPHTLSNRSVIVSLASRIEVKVLNPRPSELAAGDIITVRRSRHTVLLLHLAGSSFFQSLRHKLHWSGTNI
jgi:NAD+ kinase